MYKGRDGDRVVSVMEVTGAGRCGADNPAVPSRPDTQPFSSGYVFVLPLKEHLDRLLGYTGFFEREDLLYR